MAVLANGLPVLFIQEKRRIATMRDDMMSNKTA
jgi:hypothetical protein